MRSDSINTARLNALLGIDWLSEPQLTAVRELRRFAESQNVSPYTVGILCARNLDLLVKLSDGKRYARLSPASRELLIAEVRERLDPYEPSVVAVWSAWCNQNDVDPGEPDGETFRTTHEDLRRIGEVIDRAAARRPVLVGLPGPVERLRAIAERYHCSSATVARWAEMQINQNGYSYGRQTMPDRESDEGIELAEEVFQACHPFSPDSISMRERRA